MIYCYLHGEFLKTWRTSQKRMANWTYQLWNHGVSARTPAIHFFTQRLSWCYKVLWHDVYSIPFRFHKVSFVPHFTRSASPLSVIRTVNHHLRCRFKHQSKGNLFQRSLYFLCQHPVQPFLWLLDDQTVMFNPQFANAVPIFLGLTISTNTNMYKYVILWCVYIYIIIYIHIHYIHM